MSVKTAKIRDALASPALWAGIALVLGGIIVGLAIVQHQKSAEQIQTQRYLTRSNYWAATQIEFEILRFSRAVDRYVGGVERVSHGDVMLRFNILWSRVPIFLNSNEAAAAREIDGATRTVRELRARLRDLEPLVQGLGRGADDDRQAIQRALAPVEAGMHDVVTELLQGEAQAKRRAEMQALQREDLYVRLAIAGVAALIALASLLAIGHSRRQAAREAAARQAAVEASEAKSRFLANMSHELRTPLNAIMGFAQMMRDEMLGKHGVPQYQTYSRDIHDSAEHLLTIISDVLDIARIEADKVQTEEDDFNVREALRVSLRMVTESASAKNITLTEELPPGDVHLLGDARLFRQVCLNLLSNSVKFCADGAHVRLTCRPERQGLILEVGDDGPGIPDPHLDRVTEAFHQVQEHAHHHHEGSGLGLTLAKSFVEMHGGTFTVSSEAGHGTLVHARFPPSRVRRMDPGPGTRDPDGETDRAQPVEGAIQGMMR